MNILWRLYVVYHDCLSRIWFNHVLKNENDSCIMFFDHVTHGMFKCQPNFQNGYMFLLWNCFTYVIDFFTIIFSLKSYKFISSYNWGAFLLKWGKPFVIKSFFVWIHKLNWCWICWILWINFHTTFPNVL